MKYVRLSKAQQSALAKMTTTWQTYKQIGVRLDTLWALVNRGYVETNRNSSGMFYRVNPQRQPDATPTEVRERAAAIRAANLRAMEGRA